MIHMLRSLLESSTVRLVLLATGAVFIFGITISLWKTSSEDNRLRKELLILARTAAQSISIDKLKRLDGSPLDLVSPDYQWIKNQLAVLRAGIPRCRFLYLMGRDTNGMIYFYVDSEPADSVDYSPPGQEFFEADDAIHQVFITKKEIVDGPTTDRWGTWVSGLIPMLDPDTGVTLAVFGMDIDSSDWQKRVILNSAAMISISVLMAFFLAISFIFHKLIRWEKEYITASETSLRQVNAKLDDILNSIDAIIIEFDLLQDCITFVNKEIESLLGYPADYWLGQGVDFWWKHVHPDDRDAAMLACDKDIQHGRDHVIEYRFLTAKGSSVWLRDYVSLILENNRLVKLRCMMVDITNLKNAESNLRRYEHIVSSSQHFMSFIDRDYKFRFINDAYKRAFNKTRENIIGHTLSELYGEKFFLTHQKIPFDKALTGEPSGYEAWFDLPLIGRRYMIINYTPYYDDKFVSGIIVSAHDITDRKLAEELKRKHEEKIEHLAYHDVMTNLPNRALFLERLGQVLAQGNRDSSIQAAILFADLDRFKTINDTLGHATGDELLRHMAARMRDVLREGDTVARLGGDEFVILLPRLLTAQEAAQVAAKSVEIMAAPFLIHGHELHVTTSLGISLYPKDGEDVETLLKHADTALYQAKNLGRNQYQFFNRSMNAQAHERLLLENSLRKALERNEFMLYYQPQVDLRTGKTTGIEALIRWKHPEHGMIFPNDFIPIAEETGMINEIAEWVIKTACRQVSTWQKSGFIGSHFRVAVNLSARQLQLARLPEMIRTILKKTELKPEFLELEITESNLMADPESAIVILQKLHNMGIHITVDDFGTGYSSLAYLKRLPIDRIKIDRSFVNDIPGDENDVAIVQAILAIAQQLNMHVLAEGVETIEQRNFLLEQNCEEAQGYLFSKPLSPEDCSEFLEKEQITS
jgi:diguanylate cyclase (GGDEF)-like protein/PAS domain S-box-containing protein